MLSLVVSPARFMMLSRHVAERTTEFVRDHLDKMAKTRHRWAKKLGARPTHHFEYASGRVGGANRDGLPQSTDPSDVTATGFKVSIRNTPGILRAFGPVTAKPRNGKWLTIPIHKDAYGKRVADLRREGRVIFRPGKARILAEAEKKVVGRGKKRRVERKLRPLYALCKETTARRDRGILPTREALREKAAKEALKWISQDVGLG